MSRKTRKNKENAGPAAYNVWRVLYRFVDGVLDLINNNKIYPVFGLLLLSLLGLIVWRLPETELAEIVKLLINELVVSKGGLILIIVVTNIGWAYVLKRMNGIYQREIDRLSSIRSELMHKTDGKGIEKHRSTNEDCKESYIVPDPVGDEG